MDDRTLGRLAARLLREGVAPRHVRRCVAELRAHRADLIEQLTAQGLDARSASIEADSRLGTADDFCAATLARPELRGWASRAPWLVFAVAPLAAFVALSATLLVLTVGYFEMRGAGQAPSNPAAWHFAGVMLVAAIQWALPIGLCAALAAIAWRGWRGLGWPALGMLILCGLATALTLQLDEPAGGGKGALSVGLGYPPPDLQRAAVLLALASAAIAALYLRQRALRLRAGNG